MACKVFEETGVVPLDCLFNCDRGCGREAQESHGVGGARCNRCGSTDVRWRQQTGRWVLFNLGVGEHVCPIDDSSFKALEP